LGSDLLKASIEHEVFVETKDARFIHSSKMSIVLSTSYKVQLFDKKSNIEKSNDPHAEYNKKYLEYYTYSRMQKYIKSNKSKIEEAGFDIRIVGKSIEGRDLYAITPKKLENKKTILMFGRHHGDEGTANWIIEGFFDEYLSNKSFQSKYQLILYPMINPDGAEAHSRYNYNGRDLNR
jgi:murein tripeptide amidase MpaA